MLGVSLRKEVELTVTDQNSQELQPLITPKTPLFIYCIVIHLEQILI